MKYMTGDIMTYLGRPDAICITTNGFVTARGRGVMGMGIAKSMADLHCELPELLGTHIKQHGNVVGELMQIGATRILSFPVKPMSIIMERPEQVVKHAQDKYVIGTMVPGFHCKAEVGIIIKSLNELVELADVMKYRHVVLPIPGCGAGELSYQSVRPFCESILDDRFYMMSFKEADFRR